MVQIYCSGQPYTYACHSLIVKSLLCEGGGMILSHNLQRTLIAGAAAIQIQARAQIHTLTLSLRATMSVQWV